MTSFQDFNLSKPLNNAIADLGFEKPTPVQIEAFSIIRSGRNVVGISQTGTGKTFAYMLPILHDFKFSKQLTPRCLILVPTRELVIQLVEQISQLAKYISVRVLGVYGGVNINGQKREIGQGIDILIATPGRLFDLTVNGALKLKAVTKLVIDEVDVMLDLGFRYQLTNIFELLPDRRQNIMFSATMTEEIDEIIDDYFITPVKISIAVSGTPLHNIDRKCYAVPNFYTKVNLLAHLLKQKSEFKKVLVFVSEKKYADRLFEALDVDFGREACIIHSNKTQNYRMRSVDQFDDGRKRIMIATDVMARGLDLDMITHVINFDTPTFPENYMHRIGRTGRAEQEGKSILFYTPKEEPAKLAIENLMGAEITEVEFPEQVQVSTQLTPDERPETGFTKTIRRKKAEEKGAAFHEKSLKNQKTNQGGSYKRMIEKKYKKPKSKGDKNFNQRYNKKK